MIKRIPVLLAAAATVVAIAACHGVDNLTAQFPNTENSVTVYALNGGPAASPTGLDLKSGAPIYIDSNFGFDVAFDLDSTGKVRVYPVRVVANNLASVHSVGLQVVSATFDEYTRAVTSGYHFDSTLVAPVGATIAVNSLDVSTCSLYSLGSSYYAKFIVDSVNAAQKAFYVRLLADPNCGYRTLTGGVPNN